MVIKDYKYQSCFAHYIDALIQQKRLEGFLYGTEEYQLKHFDMFCVEQNITEPVITRELVIAWGDIRETDSKVYRSRRISVARQLALYMQSQGMDAFIPTHFNSKSHTIAHVLPDEEILSFFNAVDNYRPKFNASVFVRLSMEYRVLFRVIYCCGLRVSEARKLRNEDVNLSDGSIRINQSKGRKDRIVYLAPDLLNLCIEYKKLMDSLYSPTSNWFFPARDISKELCTVTIGLKFRQFWAETPYAKKCSRPPTVHSLRHSFVVKRMNLWMENGIAFNSMMPYLSKYLGHRSPDGTFYYYHQINSALKIVRAKDAQSSEVIPEVAAYEE